MTLAIWDGRVLATDLRRSTFSKCGENGEKTRIAVNDDAVKIDLDFPDSFFRKERVLAVATSGNVKTTRKLKTSLRKGSDIETLYEHRYTHQIQDDWKTASVLIITETNAYRFSLRPGKPPSVTKVGKRGIAIGTGARMAEYLLYSLKLDPVTIVKAVNQHETSCGGGTLSVVRKGSGMGELRRTDAHRTKRVKREVYNSIISACQKHLDEL